MSNILVVDPAITVWAYSVFSEDGALLFSKTVKLSSKDSQEDRLWKVFEELDTVKYEITHIVIENQFVNIMTQMVGMIRSFAGKKAVKTTPLVPTSWRKLLTGNGKASEELIKQTVLLHYPQMADVSEHEIDCAAMYLAYLKHKEQGNVKKPKRNKKK